MQTLLLAAWSDREQQALDDLMPIEHAELRRVAVSQLRRERRDHTLQPSALVNEAFLRFVRQNRTRWESRGQFYAFAATTMRRILLDYARRRASAKRGADSAKVSLTKVLLAVKPEVGVRDMEEVLCRLEELDPRQARVVELRVFGGCTIAETAGALDLSTSTVKREWRTAQVRLRGELAPLESPRLKSGRQG